MRMRKSFPHFEGELAGIRERYLTDIVKEIYKFENKIFSNLSQTQEKTLLGFLNLLLSSDEKENIYSIMDQIVHLTPEERDNFKKILNKTELDNVIDAIKFIHDRESVVLGLKSLVYTLKEYTNERNHIQKIIEKHFWLFGEQYQLASADQTMKYALEKYVNILYGEPWVSNSLSQDAETKKRMDIFLCQSMTGYHYNYEYEVNIIVELKAPGIVISKETIRQVENYMDYIMRRDEFNSQHREWRFIAVSNSVNCDVTNRQKKHSERGKEGLVEKINNYEIYAYTWDDIFTSFELRYGALLKRLNLNKEKLMKETYEETEKKEGRAKADAMTDIMTNQISDLN